MGALRSGARRSATMAAIKRRQTGLVTPKTLAADFAARVQADGGVTEAQSCLESRIRALREKGMWQKASAVWLPHGYKESKLYAVKGGAGADFGFIRGGTRTRKGATYLEQVPYNLLQYSEQFDNAVWLKAGTTITPNTTLNHKGFNTTDSMLETIANSEHYVQEDLTKPAVSVTYHCTFFAKSISRDFVWIQLDDSVANGVKKFFNISTGIVSSTTVFGTGFSFVNAAITAEPNGFYRCEVLVTTNTATTFTVKCGVAIDSATSSYVGDVTKGAYLGGCQLVHGSTARDYFSTTNRFNVPALDYTGSTCPALSLEPARTNLLLWSEAFDNASWTKTEATVTANNTAGPENLSTADAIFETATTTRHLVSQSIAKAASAIQYTVSVYAKTLGRDWIYLEGADGTSGVRAWFNITTGVKGTTVIVGTGWTIQNSTIEPAPNGFYRVTFTYTTSAVGSLTNAIYPTTADANAAAYLGEVTKGVYLLDAQLEQASYATSYIKTEAATVSRVADAVPALTGVSSLIGQTEGTLYFEGSSFADGITKAISINDGTINNRIILAFIDTNVIRCNVIAGNVVYANIDNAGFTTGTNYKIAIVYKNNYAALFVNGSKIGEDLSVTVPNCDAIRFTVGRDIDTQFSGNVKALIISKTAISDSEAISLTT